MNFSSHDTLTRGLWTALLLTALAAPTAAQVLGDLAPRGDTDEALTIGDAVVALGGGAVSEPATAAAVTEAGTMVYLRARPETLLARVGDAESRPLLAGLDPTARLARLRELADAREAAYAVAAIQVETDARSEEEVVEAIVEQLGAGR